MTKKIVWEKWVDPLQSSIEATQAMLDEEENDEEAYPDENSEYDDEYIKASPLKPLGMGIKKFPIISTPFGMLSPSEHAFASSQFDFWVMHTNFDINEGIATLLERMPGIETLEITTRYRARIGFPKSGLFKPRDVMAKIQKLISEISWYENVEKLDGLPTDVIEKVMSTYNEVSKKYNHWCILVLPNGSIDIVGCDDLNEDYNKKLESFRLTQEFTGSYLLVSEND